jgi:hypothetical protein
MNAFQRFTFPVLALAALPTLALAVSQTVEPVATPAKIRCNSTVGGGVVYAVHADKIIFRLGGPLVAVNPVDQVNLDKIPRNTELDIKVLDDPERIADLRGKVLSFVGAVDSAVARDQVAIIDVDYAMVCPVKPFALPTAG